MLAIHIQKHPCGYFSNNKINFGSLFFGDTIWLAFSRVEKFKIAYLSHTSGKVKCFTVADLICRDRVGKIDFQTREC